MNRDIDVLGRLLARRQGRAVQTRRTAAIITDPPLVFAIAPIKMVAEETVQAIAFGDPDAEPRIVTRWNPLSRDAGGLEVFAACGARKPDWCCEQGLRTISRCCSCSG